MKINFLLPGTSTLPTGGTKVVLEYANRLAADNISVTLIYPLVLRKDKVSQLSLLKKISVAKKLFTKRLKKKYAATAWFPLHHSIQHKLVANLGEDHIPAADFTFATSWETAEWLQEYGVTKGEKCYLIQDYEEWSGTKEEIERTWKFPFRKIVIAEWLKDYVNSLGQSVTLIHNGLDFKKFSITRPVEVRNPASVIMLYHRLALKGSAYGLAALEIVKQRIPELEVTFFSSFEKPYNIPAWINYHHHPSNLPALYNDAAIFISSSTSEGWGLPRAEAMQCGCAVIITDIPGHRGYGVDGEHFVLSPVKNSVAMAENIIRLIEDDAKRIAIAKAGNKVVQLFTWEAAYQKFKAFLLEGVAIERS